MAEITGSGDLKAQPATVVGAGEVSPSAKDFIESRRQVLAGESEPEILYHYTSAAGLIGILKKRNIWATSIRHLNDASEFIYTLITNPRGSTGYGQDSANIVQYRYPGDDFRDLMAAVDSVVARGFIDETRMGIAGGSGGGVLASWAVGKTQRFTAALVERPVVNWHSFVTVSDRNAYFVRHWFRDFPWRNPDDYLARSPLSLVDRVTIPVLVIQSIQDYRTPVGQGLQYYTALKMLDKEARLALFPDSSHGLSRNGRPSQRVQRLEIILKWFAEKLKPPE